MKLSNCIKHFEGQKAAICKSSANTCQVVDVIQSTIDRKIVVIGYGLLEENVSV